MRYLSLRGRLMDVHVFYEYELPSSKKTGQPNFFGFSGNIRNIYSLKDR